MLFGAAFFLVAGVIWAATTGVLDFRGAVLRSSTVGLVFSQASCDPGGDATECVVTVTHSGKWLNFNINLDKPGDSQIVTFCVRNVGTLAAGTDILRVGELPERGVTVAPLSDINSLILQPREEICENDGEQLAFFIQWDPAFPNDVSSVSFSYYLQYAQYTRDGFYVWDGDDSKIPIGIPGGDTGLFFTPQITGGQNVEIINQSIVNGDLSLSLCAANANNGNTDWSVQFQMSNLTTYTWTGGRTTLQSPAPGGLPNTRFLFTGVVLSHQTLAPEQTATVTLNMRSQLGQADAGGSAQIRIFYTIQGTERETLINFTYIPRQSPECPLN
ncbi:hypothetical protein FWG76_02100 [Candidatus Saccharibacteria bacterium]|nr:hypothetical protein [Candidatus Saccharibacteria bacterium]